MDTWEVQITLERPFWHQQGAGRKFFQAKVFGWNWNTPCPITGEIWIFVSFSIYSLYIIFFLFLSIVIYFLFYLVLILVYLVSCSAKPVMSEFLSSHLHFEFPVRANCYPCMVHVMSKFHMSNWNFHCINKSRAWNKNFGSSLVQIFRGPLS